MDRISRAAIGVVAGLLTACGSTVDSSVANALHADSLADASTPGSAGDAGAPAEGTFDASPEDPLSDATVPMSRGADAASPLLARDANPAGPDVVASGADVVVSRAPGVAAAHDVVIDPGTPHQTIAGFGASDVFLSGLTPAQARLFFDPVNGIGLSLLRVGIASSGFPLGSGALEDVTLATSYGASVWAAPWSPPASDKSNASEDNGGYLCASAPAQNCTAVAKASGAAALSVTPGSEMDVGDPVTTDSETDAGDSCEAGDEGGPCADDANEDADGSTDDDATAGQDDAVNAVPDDATAVPDDATAVPDDAGQDAQAGQDAGQAGHKTPAMFASPAPMRAVAPPPTTRAGRTSSRASPPG
jgi:hypothetical protein